jgi:hypothetical protein
MNPLDYTADVPSPTASPNKGKYKLRTMVKIKLDPAHMPAIHAHKYAPFQTNPSKSEYETENRTKYRPPSCRQPIK